VGSALLRYRVVAWVVGTVLLVLVFVAMPLKYLADRPAAVAIVGPIHGFLFIVYLIATFDISMRQRWPLTRMLVLGLAGTVPVLTFVAERWVTRQVRSKQLA
jgi:integral membrane protein